MSLSSSVATAASRFGNLWGRSHETFSPKLRRILSVKGTGDHATKYLQGLVTCDLRSEPTTPRNIHRQLKNEFACNSVTAKGETIANNASYTKEINNEILPKVKGPPQLDIKFTSNMRAACFLDAKGRILTDAILWKRPFTDPNAPLDKYESNDEVEYLIDVPGDTADLLLGHLKKYKLRRSNVKIDDLSKSVTVHCVYGTLNVWTPSGFLAVSFSSNCC